MTIPSLIDTKQKYYKYAKRGIFGNQLRVWYTKEEFEESGYEGEIGLRYTGGGSGAPWLGNKIQADCAITTLDLQNLFEWFPEHTIEFASFAVPVGNLAGRNTIIWEVRKDGAPPGWYVTERMCRRAKMLRGCSEE